MVGTDRHFDLYHRPIYTLIIEPVSFGGLSDMA